MSAVEISHHAVERFRERVRPTLSVEQAEDELARLLAEYGEWVDGPPDWHFEHPHADGWLMLGDSIVFPVAGGLVITCICRAGYAAGARRNATNANNYARRARRAKENPAIRKWQGKEAKQNRRVERDWEDDAA